MAEYNKIIAVVGPTASGKTSLAVELCKRFNGEAVSCDSMQIYKDMSVATAAPAPEEMQGIKHHLVEFVEPCEKFSVAKYCSLANECISDIISRSKIPVIVGGTGLYFSSLIDNVEFFDEPDNSSIRQALKEKAEKYGVQSLLDELLEIDPETASSLHVNNCGRIIRALEVYKLTGITLSETKRRSRLRGSKYNPVIIGLDAEKRDFLYERIDRRVDIMLQNGLLDEAKRFYLKYNGETSMQAIGYKELKPYLDGIDSLENCVANLKLSTRHYAKRQLTWFRKDERIHFLKIDNFQTTAQLADAACEIIKEVIQLEPRQ